jgi:hypothetical protein
MDEKIQQEITNILRQEQTKIMAEEAHDHASMLLLARMHGKVGLLAVLCKQMYDQGPDFTTATLSSLAVSARNLGQRFAANPDADFSDALRSASRGDRITQMAHRYLERIMSSTTLDEGVAAGNDLRSMLQTLPPLEGASLAMHVISASAQLVTITMGAADEHSLEHIRGDHDDR